ncbi:response regulator transcription factor [Algiphilus aromaticivorans]|jgi:DNA-binding response OmpR family regulator|uniref:response regulator transcription factor n=1 Tax=Algiphilus aromaticivorans TaxID=382454 RepID=UPI0005C1F264|nr:response regulator [Algiphilus aromaticivorans]
MNSTTPPARVLVVDDEPGIVTSLEFLLKQAGFTVSTATDGDSGLEKAQAERPDLILLDIMMPGRDGFEVCQTLRADPAMANTKIVMLTARSRDAEQAKGLALGADDYITKPFSTRDLVARVQELLAA